MQHITTPQALIKAGFAGPEEEQSLITLTEKFTLSLSPALEAYLKIVPDPVKDPVGRQFIPHPDELTVKDDELADPIGDETFSPVPGLVHRYPDRVLLKPLLLCAAYCRFCFRREQVGQKEALLSEEDLHRTYHYIEAHPEIREVILTGGDPLLLAPRRLQNILQALEKIPHIDLLRIHTRFPMVAPERVNPDLLQALKTGKTLWLALHINHRAELTDPVKEAIAKFRTEEIPLLAQTVLLKGINDTPETLGDLFTALLKLKIKPYYLHHPDKARGTSHFYVSKAKGQRIFAALRGKIPGHAIPDYILDIPGGYGKVTIGLNALTEKNTVIDRFGQEHDLAPEAEEE